MKIIRNDEKTILHLMQRFEYNLEFNSAKKLFFLKKLKICVNKIII